MQPRRVAPVPLVASVVALVAALVFSGLLGGCGGTTTVPVKTGDVTVSVGDRVCREQWSALGDRLRTASSRGVLLARAFSSQWDSVQAGIAYYEVTADQSQCGAVLDRARDKITALSAVLAKALPYDLEHRRVQADEQRDAYSALHPKTKEPTRVRAAYRTLRVKYLRGERDIGPAVTELAAVDPSDAKAVRRGLEDLALLAGTSNAFRACSGSLSVIHAYLHPAKKRHKKKG